MPQSTQIDTAKLTSRRSLHFDLIDQALAEADRLAEAQKQGKLKTLGNWSAGQNLGHLASWVQYSYDGVPFKVPFIAKVVMWPMKNRTLNNPMKSGTKIPNLPGGTAGIEPLSFEDGLARFRKNFTRLKSECPQKPNALLGPLSHEEWIALHLRHAELHLAFMKAE